MDEPNIVKLNQQRRIKKKKKPNRIELKSKLPNRIKEQTNYRCWKIRRTETTTTQNTRQHEQIEEEERKEKRMLMKMEEWLDDHATRRMVAPR